MAATKKNGEEIKDVLPDFSTWEEETTGFAPYWNPTEGEWFFGKILDKDDRDPEFVRYLFEAGVDTECKKGPADDAEDILVKKGDLFTISVYYSLEHLFDFYLESGIMPFMRVTATEKTKTKNSGRTVWQWKVQVSPETKRLLTQKRAEYRKLGGGNEFPPRVAKKDESQAEA